MWNNNYIYPEFYQPDFQYPTRTALVDKIIYSLNDEEKTAKVISNDEIEEVIIIPPTFTYESQEYTVTSIGKHCLRNTHVDTYLPGDPIYRSSFTEIIIPSSIKELDEGWCEATPRLSKVTISPENPYFKMYNDEFIIGKSTKEQEKYDVLVFCIRNIDIVNIPDFIEIIGPYSFDDCRKITKFIFPKESKLKIIDRFGLANLRINNITFPSSLCEFREGWCDSIVNLVDIEISPENPYFKTYKGEFIIGKSTKEQENFDVLVFCIRKIKTVKIPNFIEIIGPHAFNKCDDIEIIFQKDSKLKIIGESAFEKSSIKAITIPSSVIKICKNAFANCKNLNQFIIPENSQLQSIEDYAFNSVPLKNFKIPIHLKQIGEGAFYGLNIEQIDIPNNSELEVIEKYAFSCSKIRCFSTTNKLKKIGECAFYRCNKLEKIDILPSSNLLKIEKCAFSDSSIETITIQSFLIEFDNKCFCNTKKLQKIIIKTKCSNLQQYDESLILGKSSPKNRSFNVITFASKDVEKVKIPSSIEIIGQESFKNCENLNEITFSFLTKLQIIENYAFESSNIHFISVPSSLTRICIGAFYSCYNLYTIEFPKKSQLKVIEKLAFAESSICEIYFPIHLTLIDKKAFYGCNQLTKVEFPENSELKIIEESAFSKSAIEKLSLPSHVSQIGKYAFGSCKYLQNIEIPEDSELKIIEEGSFSGTGIKNITIPSHITKICQEAFKDCNRLENIKFSENSELTIIENDAFPIPLNGTLILPANVTELKTNRIFTSKINSVLQPQKLAEINVDPRNKNIQSFHGKFIFGKSSKEQDNFDVLIFSIPNIESVIIPDNIEIIGPNVFSENKNITSVQFSNNSKLRIIGNNAFSKSSIKDINVPSSLIEIGENAFYDCENLQQFWIPNDSKLQIIGNSSFSNSNIKDINIPSSLIKICDYAFCSCKNLQQFIIPADSKLQIIGKSAFSYSKIENILIQSHVKQIEDDAFSYCKKLNEVKFQENSELCLIGQSAFKFTSIKKIIIPSHVKKISYSAFSCCSNLIEIVFEPNSELQVIESRSFESTSIKEITFPSSLTLICDFVLDYCQRLQRIKFLNGKNQLKIKNDAFKDHLDNLISISFPSNLSDFQKEWIDNIKSLKEIIIDSNDPYLKSVDNAIIYKKSNAEQENYNILVYCFKNVQKLNVPDGVEIICKEAFCHSQIQQITLPSSLTKICKYAFCMCKKLTQVEIPENSNLQIIEANAFKGTSITNIILPSTLTFVGQEAFGRCSNLEKIEFLNGKNQLSIDKEIFELSTIENIIFPSNLVELNYDWHGYTKKLKELSIDLNNPLFMSFKGKLVFQKAKISDDNYSILHSSICNIKRITIPSFIEIIKKRVFYDLNELHEIEFEKDSKLKIIEKSAFRRSKIEKMLIPPSLIKIEEDAFYYCDELQRVDVTENSQLQIIEKSVFEQSSIRSFVVPSTVTKICAKSFRTSTLQIIEINANSQLQINELAFDMKNGNLVIMVTANMNLF